MTIRSIFGTIDPIYNAGNLLRSSNLPLMPLPFFLYPYTYYHPRYYHYYYYQGECHITSNTINFGLQLKVTSRSRLLDSSPPP